MNTLTPEALALARQLRADGSSLTEAAQRLGVNRRTISRWMERGDAILAQLAKPKFRKPRIRHKRGVRSARKSELTPKIIAELAAGSPLTAAEIAGRLGVEEVRIVSSLLCSLERMSEVERDGMDRSGHEPRPLWSLPRARAVQETPTPVAPPREYLRYASPFSEFMGEPPIGRSALDARRAQA